MTYVLLVVIMLGFSCLCYKAGRDSRDIEYDKVYDFMDPIDPRKEGDDGE